MQTAEETKISSYTLQCLNKPQYFSLWCRDS